MRLRLEPLLLAAALFAAPEVAAQPEETAARAGAPTRDEVRKALDKVANDPNLAPERTVRMLRFVERSPSSADEPWWLRSANAAALWLRGLFNWLAESGRYVVWAVGAVVVLAIAAYVLRRVRGRGLPRVPQRFVAPSHVRDLDIRPESLPDDVGAAALVLWERGDERAALALLYRGFLSRLVHAHEAPIRASSTEGECLTLARLRLAAAGAEYASRLVAVWSLAVYGGMAPPAAAVRALCSEFGTVLGRTAAVSA